MSSLRLSDNSEFHLSELLQANTYAGLLEGMPTSQMNAKILQKHQKTAVDRWGIDPLVIQPKATKIDVEDYPFGNPESIPEITCMSLWTTIGQSHGDKYGSFKISVIWYQKEFALPIDLNILNQIQALKLKDHARFVEW